MPDASIKLYDFKKGLIRRGASPLAFPIDALSAGSNVRLANGGIKCRNGYSIVARMATTETEASFEGLHHCVNGLWQVYFPGVRKTYLVAACSFDGGYHADDTGDRLFFFPDTLPPEVTNPTPEFQLGPVTGRIESDQVTPRAPGPFSLAIIGERGIFTEGVAWPPWVFLGGLDTVEYSDWAIPKAVLVSRDGGYAYDITGGVCDGDRDTTANVANIAANGGLQIVTDVPDLFSLYVEMGGINTLTPETATPSSVSVTLDSADKWEQRDLKGTIDHWVQDSGATGHFEDASNNPVTLGSGNTADEVEIGLTVVFADSSTAIIETITDDGEGSGEVELNTSIASQDVTAIYGLVQGTGKVEVSGYGAWSTIFDRTAIANSSGQILAADKYVNFRELMLGTTLGTQARLRFTVKNEANIEWPLDLQEKAYFGPRSGTTKNFASTPTEVMFSELAGPLAVGDEVTSDPIQFATAPGTNYLFAHSVKAAAYDSTHIGYRYALRSGGDGWYKSAAADDPESGALVGDQTSTLYSHGLIKKVEAQDTPSLPSAMMILESTDAGKIDIGSAEAFYGLTFSERLPGTTVAYWAFSLDNKSTFMVWTGSAAQIIVKFDSVWKYWDGAAFQAATINSRPGALKEAFSVGANQVDSSTWAAMDAADWLTFGWQPYAVSWLCFACSVQADGTNIPDVTSITANVGDVGAVKVKTYVDGQWVEEAWTDGTAVDNVPLAQSGEISFNGATPDTPSSASYATINGVQGYHRFIELPGTSELCSITRITYRAPMQALRNIGINEPDKALMVLWEDVSEGTLTDISVYMADNDHTVLGSADIPMETGDNVYVCGLYPYNEIDLIPFVSNTEAAALSGAYHDGTSWASSSLVDGTTEVSGKTFSGSGKLSFPLPADWQPSMPFATQQEYGYWTRFTVSATLAADTALAEVRLYTVPPVLVKYRYACAFADRLSLLDRPDQRSQADISRTMEEYGFVGDDAAANDTGIIAGSTGSIVAVVEAWNTVIVFKERSAHILVGSSPADFRFVPVEISRMIPINSRVIAKAPMDGNEGARPALWYINQYGAFAMTGAQADDTYATLRAQEISKNNVDWWLPGTHERIDLEYLHLACGVYWPVDNQVKWAVPMRAAGQTEAQDACNCIITFDLEMGAWLPPDRFMNLTGDGDLEIGALATVHHYNAEAPNRLGELALYAGVESGFVVRLEDPNATMDNGADIGWFAETGWLGFNRQTEHVRDFVMYGTSDNRVDLGIYLDGNETPTPIHGKAIMALMGLAGKEFSLTKGHSLNAKTNFLKARFEGVGPAYVFAEIGVNAEREVGS